jgi:hypothetical protein
MSAKLVTLAENIVAEMNADASFYDVKGQAQADKLVEDQTAKTAETTAADEAYVAAQAALHSSHLSELSVWESEKNTELDNILGVSGDEADIDGSLHAVIKYINEWDGENDTLAAAAIAAEEARLSAYITETGVSSETAFGDAYEAILAGSQS